ncbi:MAG: MogA/MoaB family molybdenum cofactor biosynthesis protein [Planctomycetota bacterium]
MSDPTTQHRRAAANRRARCAVLTVSDTRTRETDKGGQLITRHLETAGHEVVDYQIVKDEPLEISNQLRGWLSDHNPFDSILTTGGTGISSRDTTVEVARQLLTKELEGFGELFRMLSYEEVGPAAMLSRAVAGLAGDTLLFTLPGSTNAVELAMSKLILPELPHLIWERSR